MKIKAGKAPVNSLVVEIVSGSREIGPVTVSTLAKGKRQKPMHSAAEMNRSL